MSEQDLTSNRRKVLKLVAGTTALGGIGTVSGEDAEQGEQELVGSNSKSGGESGSKRDYEDLIEAREVPIQTQQSDEIDYLSYVDHVEQEYDVDADETGVTIAETDHSLTLREAVDENGDRVFTNDGEYVYVFEHYSKSEGQHRAWHGDPKTTSIENHLGFSSNSYHVEARDPATTDTRDGEWVTVGMSVDVDGTGASIENPVFVDNGQIGPGEYSPGESGEYPVQFSGCSEQDVTDLIGYTLVYSTRMIIDLEDEFGVSWSTSVEARTSGGGPCDTWA